jgi:hypothetical protein
VEDQATGVCRRINVLGKGEELCVTALDGFDDAQEIPKGSSQAITLGDDDHVARPDLAQKAVQFGPLAQ